MREAAITLQSLNPISTALHVLLSPSVFSKLLRLRSQADSIPSALTIFQFNTLRQWSLMLPRQLIRAVRARH
jgi:hypothetical protein